MIANIHAGGLKIADTEEPVTENTVYYIASTSLLLLQASCWRMQVRNMYASTKVLSEVNFCYGIVPDISVSFKMHKFGNICIKGLRKG